jgi:hypothetical protein
VPAPNVALVKPNQPDGVHTEKKVDAGKAKSAAAPPQPEKAGGKEKVEDKAAPTLGDADSPDTSAAKAKKKKKKKKSTTSQQSAPDATAEAGAQEGGGDDDEEAVESATAPAATTMKDDSSAAHDSSTIEVSKSQAAAIEKPTAVEVVSGPESPPPAPDPNAGWTVVSSPRRKNSFDRQKKSNQSPGEQKPRKASFERQQSSATKPDPDTVEEPSLATQNHKKNSWTDVVARGFDTAVPSVEDETSTEASNWLDAHLKAQLQAKQSSDEVGEHGGKKKKKKAGSITLNIAGGGGGRSLK